MVTCYDVKMYDMELVHMYMYLVETASFSYVIIGAPNWKQYGLVDSRFKLSLIVCNSVCKNYLQTWPESKLLSAFFVFVFFPFLRKKLELNFQG